MTLPAWAENLIAQERLPDTYRHEVQTVVSPVAEWIAGRRNAALRPVIVGLNGAQGSGKSTLALFLQHWLIEELGMATARVSIDDLYLTRADRQALANAAHPLFQTRGVPGTHDLSLGKLLLDRLTDPDAPQRSVPVPAFDKAADDRVPERDWPAPDAPVVLEELEDPDGAWRRSVNEHLGNEYAELWEWLDALVMLRVPSFDVVFKWRALQERKLRERTGDDTSGQDEASLEHFIRHYERLTRHMLATMPDYADLTIDVDEAHRMSVVEDLTGINHD